ncbi:MAG: hypothetical protein J6Z01_15415 [Bacteroidales bacterium]|nr:hypothetical protein [Bacteroidales bacterium]
MIKIVYQDFRQIVSNFQTLIIFFCGSGRLLLYKESANRIYLISTNGGCEMTLV